MRDTKEIAQKIGQFVYSLLFNVYQQLGSGFSESVYQNAFAIELREKGLQYLREINLEIFYKGQAIGNDRPDFVILGGKIGDLEIKFPILIEMKVTNTITNDHRQQLKTYFLSLSQSKDKRLRNAKLGLLVKILKSEDYRFKEKKKEPIEIEMFYFDEIKREMRIINKEC